MSIDINWPALTSGPDGLAVAEQIRDFIHDKFQAVPLPRFIQSVAVHRFEFGDVPPEVELKDICEPLGDFYEEGEGDAEEDGEAFSDDEVGGEEVWKSRRRREDEDEYMSSSRSTLRERRGVGGETLSRSATTFPVNAAANATSTGVSSTSQPHINPPPYIDPRLPAGLRAVLSPSTDTPPFIGRSPTPIVPGGTSTLNHYFHSPLTTGLSGTQTPLAAVAGAHLPPGWLEHSATITGTGEGSNAAMPHHHHHYEHDNSASVSPPSTANSTSAAAPQTNPPPPTIPPQDPQRSPSPSTHRRRRRTPRPSDFQVIARVRYAGNISLSLTASILLDYPMPSFVSIPCKLNITGLTFDGVAVLAFVRRRNVHFCFLAPEDAVAMTGVEDGKDDGVGGGGGGGGLLREIKVESEIGQREGGKQVLKNVGKVEKFVLEQVRRIFEEEFVYPSFWTFLV